MPRVMLGDLSGVATAAEQMDRGVWERLARLYAELEKRDWSEFSWEDFGASNRVRMVVQDALTEKGLLPSDYYVILTPDLPPQGPLPEGWEPEGWRIDIRLVRGRQTEKVEHIPTIAEKARQSRDEDEKSG